MGVLDSVDGAVDIDAFLSGSGPILDTRSPGEFAQGHVPGALSFPLFDDEERAQVGTCYRQEGPEVAMDLGLALVAPKLVPMVQRARSLAQDGALRIYCWRGGLRSQSTAQLLTLAGLKVTRLAGGYKSFRGWVRETLAVRRPVITLGGMTGTGKTAVLAALAELGEWVLDLEDLANHRGSSYGALGLPPQPTTEHFENLVAIAWRSLPPDRPIWIEAESRGIGTCRVPIELFEQMMAAPVLEVVRSIEDRIEHLIGVYGQTPREHLLTATERIRKRLGGDRTRQALAHIEAGEAAAAIKIVLGYYDKTYRYDLERRQVPVYPVDAVGCSALETARRMVAQARSLPRVQGTAGDGGGEPGASGRDRERGTEMPDMAAPLPRS